MRGAASKTLTVLGSIVLLLGVLAGLVNRNVLDGQRFARHVDAVRSNPAVARQVGIAITDQVIALQPNLVAIRPLVQSTAITLVESATFSSIVREAAVQLHAAFTDKDKGHVVLRLADAGAVLVGVLRTVAPEAAARLPSDLDVTLADVGSQTFAARTIHFARTMALLSWLLPLLSALLLAGAIVVARERWRAVIHTGIGIAASGAAVGLFAIVVSLLVSRADTDTLRGAITAAAWDEVRGSVWWAAALVVVAGSVLAVAAAGLVPRLDLAMLTRRAWAVLTARPTNRWALLGHGLLVGVVAVGILYRPGLLFAVIGALIGLVLLVVGVAELAAAGGAVWVGRAVAAGGDGRRGHPRRWLLGVLPGAALAVVVALVVVDSAGVNRSLAAPARTTDNPYACNGFVALCDRPYNDVAFAGTHNSMTAANENWFLPEQPNGVIAQLNAGIRVFLIDSWYGQTTTQRGLIATAEQNYAEALETARQEYGEATVQAGLRLRNALAARPVGPPTPYLCHGLCELGATEWEPLMVQVRKWMQAHPREVISFFVEDNVSPADTAKVFEQSGLVQYAYQPEPGKPWPTLGQMIDSGKRMVVLMQRHGGGTQYPWLLQGFDWAQDTSYSARSVAQLSCAINRGKPGNPLLMLNYWLNNFQSLVSDASRVNAYRILWPFAKECEAQRGRLPNFIAVNYYNRGDLFKVVDQLNGVG